MRNYDHIEGYLDRFVGDIYAQPEGHDEHTNLTYKVVDLWMSRLTGCKNVLDVGCGEGATQDIFKVWNVEYEGVCLGEDYLIAREKGRNVKKMDFSFLEYPDNSFDLIFSRHSLEHSPMPLLTLSEWARVSRQWLGVIVPSPEWYGVKGSKNHYYVLYPDQWVNLLENAGWNVIWNEVDVRLKDENNPESMTPHEYWLFAEKRR